MSSNLKVLVIGAGLGGLTLAILLEQAGIPFIVIEKRSDFSPLGSSISLNQAVQPFFEQLGMLQEMEAISKPIQCMTFLKENMSKIGSLDLYSDALRYGYYNRITDRPSLYRLLLSRISPQNVVLNKRVADIKQGRDNVIVRCADGTVLQADIVVGADGAYSTVRRCLYQDLEDKGLLPKADLLPLSIDQQCLVDLQQETSDMMVVVGKDKPYSGNRLAWRVTYNMTPIELRSGYQVNSSDWGPDRVSDMVEACRDFVCPYGGTLGDIFDQTPRGRISQVLLEEKGAAQAMLDAISLANILYEIPSKSLSDIQTVFEAYKKERAALGKAAVQGSRQMGRLSAGRKWSESVVRTMFLNMVPAKIQQQIADKIFYIRPQATFLPFVEDRGSHKAKPQKPSTRMRTLTGPCSKHMTR
ncbi:hypothetical protein CPC16_005582 [Podila verticillata]|nr:hypothetical protein BGZ59_007404 [Podila verticillata]KAF9389764.1 hypothetical protein CPC16_005582 [Podila verticillata]